MDSNEFAARTERLKSRLYRMALLYLMNTILLLMNLTVPRPHWTTL
jgi:hypothetical protein